MKKSIKWLLPPVAAITLFFACKKNDRQASDNLNGFTVETVKAWFTGNFASTAEYKNGTKNGTAIKMPHWKMGRVYQIGKYNVAEFPLYINNRHVYISEQLPDADARRVVAGTLYRALFVQAPGRPMEVRIVQFTPTQAFLASKSYDISSLSFNNYVAQGFKGDMMLFDFDDNFKKGYHFSSGTTKEIHLYNKIAETNRSRQAAQSGLTGNTGAATRTESGELCEGMPIDPNCYYQIHTEYEYACSGGWNPLEGFNPSYCYITQIITVSCTLQYCLPGGGSLYDECLNSGSTEAECMCQVYGIGCGGSGGGGEEQDCKNLEMAQTAVSSDEKISVTPIGSEYDANGETLREKKYLWQFARNSSGLFKWQYVSVEKGVHKKTGNEWKWKSLNHDTEIKEVLGPVIGFEVDLVSFVNLSVNVGQYYSGLEHAWTIKQTLICRGSPVYSQAGNKSAAIFSVDE